MGKYSIMKFLIQSENGNVIHDFSFTLLNIIKYQNKINNTRIEYRLSDSVLDNKDCIPIGSVEFVIEYMKHWFDINPPPINVPEQLLDYRFTKREIFNGTNIDIKDSRFVKSNDEIKSFTEICDIAPEGNYQISEVVDIVSEYRAFVFHGRLVGLKNYTGEFTIFPNIFIIGDMITSYTKCPPSYTLDVGITSNNDTIVIEVHDFFSCGLYGFENLNLPYMYSQTFYNLIRNI